MYLEWMMDATTDVAACIQLEAFAFCPVLVGNALAFPTK